MAPRLDQQMVRLLYSKEFSEMIEECQSHQTEEPLFDHQNKNSLPMLKQEFYIRVGQHNVVQKNVFTIPSFARKSNRIQLQNGPALVFWLVNPVVTKTTQPIVEFTVEAFLSLETLNIHPIDDQL
jgi:hypothetical protein